MAKLVVNDNSRYTVDPLFQWDKNQTLYIYGVHVNDPEIHFSNEATVRSIAVIPTVDKEGVIAADIPNSFLQKSGPLKVYICGYERSTFKTYFKIQVPVKARPRPADYTLDANDGEVYSFNELNKRISELETALNITEAQSYYGYTYDSHSAKLTETLGKFSLKKYVPIISNSLNAIRSAFENFKASVTEHFSELDKKTDNTNTALSDLADSVETLGEDIIEAKYYREPWNVDANLGYIAEGEVSAKLTIPSTGTTGQYYEKESTSIFIKNSGQILLDITVSRNSHQTNMAFVEASIRLNGVAKKTYTEFVDETTSHETYAFSRQVLLNVSKGDNLTVYVKGVELTGSSGSRMDEIICTVNGIIANIETPYTYLHLDEGDTEVTAADILNVLTGEGE